MQIVPCSWKSVDSSNSSSSSSRPSKNRTRPAQPQQQRKGAKMLGGSHGEQEVSAEGTAASQQQQQPQAEHPASRKPKGWLHPSKQLLHEGARYCVRYIGSLDINTSMKALDFETRSQLAKECLHQICEVAGLKSVDKKRKVSKKIIKMLADKPNLEHAGSNVNLTITSTSLNVMIMETQEVIANHEMPNVSFASGGDPDTLDFIAYVAKDKAGGRSCYVLECGGGLAQDVIVTIGQAFHLRYNECVRRNLTPDSTTRTLDPADESWPKQTRQDDPEYYNDLPGKMPPDTISFDFSNSTAYQNEVPTAFNVPEAYGGYGLGSIGNLIDLSSEPSSPSPFNKSADDIHEYMNDGIVPSVKGHQTDVDKALNGWATKVDAAQGRNAGSQSDSHHATDPFDMQPFEDALPSERPPLPPVQPEADSPLYNAIQQKLLRNHLHSELMQQEWFHGFLSRQQAENLLVQNGDFLVRESSASPGQFVLSGMHDGKKKHLLLVDPEGMVRTKDTVFENVAHLVQYHRSKRLPILSADSALLLRNPITRGSNSAR